MKFRKAPLCLSGCLQKRKKKRSTSTPIKYGLQQIDEKVQLQDSVKGAYRPRPMVRNSDPGVHTPVILVLGVWPLQDRIYWEGLDPSNIGLGGFRYLKHRFSGVLPALE
jgi:hypothetical protein